MLGWGKDILEDVFEDVITEIRPTSPNWVIDYNEVFHEFMRDEIPALLSDSWLYRTEADISGSSDIEKIINSNGETQYKIGDTYYTVIGEIGGEPILLNEKKIFMMYVNYFARLFKQYRSLTMLKRYQSIAGIPAAMAGGITAQDIWLIRAGAGFPTDLTDGISQEQYNIINSIITGGE